MHLFVFSLFAVVLAACNSSGINTLGLGQDTQRQAREPETDPVLGEKIVQGACPPIKLRDGTSYYRKYERGGEEDPSKVVYQAAIADTTRQCSITGDQMNIQVVAAGRAQAGPAGASGTITMPIRVAVVENGTNRVLYSELTEFQTSLPDGTPTTQFLFNDPEVNIPIAASRSVQIFIGFDEGPYDQG
ncbi:MAG: hypothetical protein AAF724_06105 [Pseudomonadota bacterium]